MASPYDAQFIEAFKAAIPWECRSWDRTRKRWIIQQDFEADLLLFLRTHGHTIVDKRQPAPSSAWAALYLVPSAPLCVAEASYKALSRLRHPDMVDGSHEHMVALNRAIAHIRHLAQQEPAHG